MEEFKDIRFGNIDFVNEEEKALSIFNASTILGNTINVVEQQIVDEDQIEEIDTEIKSVKSSVSRQDVIDMINENNNIINSKFDNVRMDINDLRSDMLDLHKNTNSKWDQNFKILKDMFNDNTKMFNDNMDNKFETMFNVIMAKLSNNAVEKVSNDKLLSDHIGNFIKDPNVIENNARQLMEPVQSVVVEVARANSMLPTIEDLISHEVSDTMDNEEIEVVFIRCEDVETSVQHNPSIDISTDVDTLIQENLFQLCNNMSLDMKDSMLIIIPDNDTDKVLDNTDGLDDMDISDAYTMDISDAYTMDISDAYKVEVISYDYALESHSGNTNDFHIVEISNITSSEVLNGHGQLAHPVIRFVDQRRVFDPGGITPQFQNIQ